MIKITNDIVNQQSKILHRIKPKQQLNSTFPVFKSDILAEVHLQPVILYHLRDSKHK